MIAERQVLTADERRMIDRGHLISEALSLTTSGLPSRAEQDIRTVVMHHLDLLLSLADSATVARLELEAIDRRLDTHVQRCRECVPLEPCPTYRLHQVRRRRLQDTSDRAMRALLRGRR